MAESRLPSRVLIDGHNLLISNLKNGEKHKFNEKEARCWLIRRLKKIKQSFRCPVKVYFDTKYEENALKENDIEIAYAAKLSGGADRSILKEIEFEYSKSVLVVSDDHHITDEVKRLNLEKGRNIQTMKTSKLFERIILM